jgi:acyl dehydratase
MLTATKKSYSLDDLRAAIGSEVGITAWRTVSQEMINEFADATDDHQFIHVDPVRASAEMPFGGTIAHGFLTLSLLSTFAYEALPPLANMTMGINYGFDSVRFMQPVKTGSRVRARFILKNADIRKSGRVLNTYDVTIEIEGNIQPALKATWLTLSMVEMPEG